MRERLLAALSARGLLAADGVTTTFGFPAWREVPVGHEPQALMDAGAPQRRLVECAHGTAPMGEDLCAAWVERAFSRLEMGYVSGDAQALYDGFCHLTDTRDLLVGMIVAVGRDPYGAGGWDYGHVGLYVGDNVVMDCVDGCVRRVPLELWLSSYGVASEPRWGWRAQAATTSRVKIATLAHGSYRQDGRSTTGPVRWEFPWLRTPSSTRSTSTASGRARSR